MTGRVGLHAYYNANDYIYVDGVVTAPKWSPDGKKLAFVLYGVLRIIDSENIAQRATGFTFDDTSVVVDNLNECKWVDDSEIVCGG
jgi:hypothetical protein